jgi:hypothetical protein
VAASSIKLFKDIAPVACLDSQPVKNTNTVLMDYSRSSKKTNFDKGLGLEGSNKSLKLQNCNKSFISVLTLGLINLL